MAINWPTVKVPTIIAVGTLFWYMAQDNANIKSQLAEQERYAVVRGQASGKNFANLNAQMDQTQDLPFRMGSQQAKTSALSDRVNRLAHAILANATEGFLLIDVIRKDLSGLRTKVEVLDGKMDSMLEKPQRGAFVPMSPRF